MHSLTIAQTVYTGMELHQLLICYRHCRLRVDGQFKVAVKTYQPIITLYVRVTSVYVCWVQL